MGELEQLILWVQASLDHLEGNALDACLQSFEVLKRDPFDDHSMLKHYENCRRYRDVQIMIAKFTDILDSFKPKC